jgi:hypothetical protein
MTPKIWHGQIIDVSFKCKSVKVINNQARPRSLHMKVKDTKPKIIKKTKL